MTLCYLLIHVQETLFSCSPFMRVQRGGETTEQWLFQSHFSSQDANKGIEVEG